MKIISKAEFDRIPDDYKGVYEDFQEVQPKLKGRRTAFLPGEGTTLFIEGVHFLVDGDYSHLPILTKDNAVVGACYLFAGGYQIVKEIYRISEEYAKANDLYYLDRVTTSEGDFALPGSDLRCDLKYYQRLNGGK